MTTDLYARPQDFRTLPRVLHRIAFGTLIALAAFMIADAPANALSPAESYASKAGNQAMKAAWARGSRKAKTAAFLKLIKRYSDIRSVARTSLGPYRKKLPANKTAEYERLVEQFTARLFASYSSSLAGRELQVLRSKRRGSKFIVVDSRITYDSDRRSSPVKWLVFKQGKGFRVADVNIQGIWLSLFIKSKFTSILRKSKGDFRPLFAYLRQ